MSILERISCSNDVKKLQREELYELCSELRSFEIEKIASTGGHLASNMGTVELTVAIHRVYDTSRDRLVFDVGHQCYTHKIITGRRESFHTLRQYGGLSGFPKPYESDDDAFIAGHASSSVSVALGMARARTLRNEDYDILALIGDGALTGGLAYEGLENAAESGEPLVIILNDNNMSINKNVGGTARMLQSLRIKPGYVSFKRWFRTASRNTPGIYRAVHRFKEWLKTKLIPGNIFTTMGLHYIGPVDGHDVTALENAISLARDMRAPTVIHVITKKGKGCPYAEEHPEKYHGVGPFDPVTGDTGASSPCFADKMGEALCRYAQNDGRVVAITAAMSNGTGLDGFASQFPDRFFDIGIAEGHATAMAAGMAKQGEVPVFAVYSGFLQRGFDMLIHDVALQHLHAVFCVDRAGLVGNDGETHHGVFDVAYLSLVPEMTVLCPASFEELDKMLGFALYEVDGPVAVRYPRGKEGEYRQCHLEPETVLRHGTDVTLAAYGVMINAALEAAGRLSEKGISAEVVKLGIITHNGFERTLGSLRKTGRLIVSEDVCASGCVGSRILEQAALRGICLKGAALLNLGDGIVTHGSVKQLMHECCVDADAIVSRAERMLNGGNNEEK